MDSQGLLTLLAVLAAIQTPVSGLALWVLNDLRSRVAHLEQLQMAKRGAVS